MLQTILPTIVTVVILFIISYNRIVTYLDRFLKAKQPMFNILFTVQM